MKISTLVLISGILLLLVIVACSPKPKYGGTEMELGTVFDLGVGKVAKVGDLTITFNGISEDSRCPEGVNCMWAGQAMANIKLANGEGSQTFDFKKEGKSTQLTTKQFKGYKVNLHDVSPYPQEGVTIDKQKYMVKLSVTN